MGTNRKGTCRYCLASNVELTRDHVLPRCFFPKKDRQKMKPILANACQCCNSGKKAKEDEWMRLFLTTPGFDRCEAATSIMQTEIRGSVPHARNMLTQHMSKMQLVNASGDGDSAPSRRTLFHISPKDQERVEKYIQTLVKGLYAANHGQPLAKEKEIRVFWATDHEYAIQDSFKPLLKEISEKNAWKKENHPVFVHATLEDSEGTGASVIWLAFYQTVHFACFVGLL